MGPSRGPDGLGQVPTSSQSSLFQAADLALNGVELDYVRDSSTRSSHNGAPEKASSDSFLWKGRAVADAALSKIVPIGASIRGSAANYVAGSDDASFNSSLKARVDSMQAELVELKAQMKVVSTISAKSVSGQEKDDAKEKTTRRASNWVQAKGAIQMQGQLNQTKRARLGTRGQPKPEVQVASPQRRQSRGQMNIELRKVSMLADCKHKGTLGSFNFALNESELHVVNEGGTEVGIDESMWSVMAIVGINTVLGNWASWYLTFLFFLNVAMQTAFLWIIIVSSMTKANYDEESVFEIRSWRRNVAHHISNYDELTDTSLAHRVCTGDSGLSVSAQISGKFDEVDEYIQHGYLVGTMMCALALVSWYMTLGKEGLSIVDGFQSIVYLPRGSTTKFEWDEKSEGYHMTQITNRRVYMRLFVTCVRFAIVALMLFYGTKFLVYTISIEELLLNAVALEFVISCDELIFASLCPMQTKSVVRNASGFRIPPMREYRGIDIRSSAVALMIIASFSWAISSLIIPQLDTLQAVHDAICAGDRDFIYSLDGIGSVSWGYPISAGDTSEALSSDERKWQASDPSGENLNFATYVLDSVLRGEGRGTCVCFDENSQYLVPRPDCCIAKQTFVAGVVGDSFSLKEKDAETAVSALDIWNPACNDMLRPNAAARSGRQNLMAGALAFSMRQTYPNEECGGFCPNLTPLCKDGECTFPDCSIAEQFCFSSSLAGVRARQMCPKTCGCDTPQSGLPILSGCPIRCEDTRAYRKELAETPCEDLSKEDPKFNDFLDSWVYMAQSWPEDWRKTSALLAGFYRKWGCDYLSQIAPPANYTGPWIPANLADDSNPCIEAAFPVPVKPLSFFCPRTCGCHAGDEHCPDTCPRRNTSEVQYTSLSTRHVLPYGNV